MSSKKNKVWLFLCMVLVLAGCGGSAPGAAKSPRSGGFDSAGFGDAEAAPPAQSGGAPRDAPPEPGAPPPAPPAPATAAKPSAKSESTSTPRAEERATRERSPDSRPGLGTEWGETRTSRIHDVTFVREASRPFAVATLHYNDRRDVHAMANLHAQRETRRDVPAGGGADTIAIKDSGGSPLEAVRVNDRTMVVRKARQRFSIVLPNNPGTCSSQSTTSRASKSFTKKPGPFKNQGYLLIHSRPSKTRASSIPKPRAPLSHLSVP